MITDIRNIIPGSLLKIDNQHVVAFHEGIKVNKQTTIYSLQEGDTVLFLDLVYLDQDFTIRSMNWTQSSLSKGQKDLYFKCVHKTNKIVIFVSTVNVGKNLPKDILNNLFATYNFTILD